MILSSSDAGRHQQHKQSRGLAWIVRTAWVLTPEQGKQSWLVAMAQKQH
jgi:hypothetical protein